MLGIALGRYYEENRDTSLTFWSLFSSMEKTVSDKTN